MFRRECLLTWRRSVEWVNPLLFFVLVSLLFPLSMIPDPAVLRLIAPGVLWVAVLLAVLLSLTRLFQADYEDGSLERWFFSRSPLSLLIFGKIAAHWLMLCVPLLLIAPLLAVMFHLTGGTIWVLILTLLLGTPLLILFGAIGAALTVNLKQNGLLMALILLPLYIPTLIFATSAISAAEAGFSPAASLAWLGVLLAMMVVLSPWISALILKMNVAYR